MSDHDQIRLLYASRYFGKFLHDVGITPTEAEFRYNYGVPYDQQECPYYPFNHGGVWQGYREQRKLNNAKTKEVNNA
jgi:hypothetical protein